MFCGIFKKLCCTPLITNSADTSIHYTLTLLLLDYRYIGGGIQSGAPVSMRTHKVGGAIRPNRSCTLTLHAEHNHRNGRPSLTQFLCHRIPCLRVLLYCKQAAVLTFVAISYRKFVGALPPPPLNKIAHATTAPPPSRFRRLCDSTDGSVAQPYMYTSL